eukprot:scaffold88272_cov57-Attheya_sp.AAC.7
MVRRIISKRMAGIRIRLPVLLLTAFCTIAQSDAFSVSSRPHHGHILQSAVPNSLSPSSRFDSGQQDGSRSRHDDVGMHRRWGPFSSTTVVLRPKQRAMTTQLNLQWSSPGLPFAVSTTSTALTLTMRAAGTLLVSVGVGKSSSSSYGTIVTLLMAAFLSNLGVAPSSHALYDVCWTHLLPASLALLLLAPSHSSTQSKSTTTTTTTTTTNNANQPSQKWNMIRK